jgi:hypothetical protein
MTTLHKISVAAAIDLLKAGSSLENKIIADLDSAKISAIDALLLAEHGIVLPDANVVYDDTAVVADPDFEGVKWGKALPFGGLKRQLEEEALTESVTIRLQVKNDDMKVWMQANRLKLDQVVTKLLEDLYQTERLLHD